MGTCLNALTFDLEEYFQVSNFERYFPRSQWDGVSSRLEEGCKKILEILEPLQVKSTFFVLGWLAERHSRLIREIHQKGHEIASHGYSHELVYRLGPKAFREDLQKSKEILESIIGERVVGYRAPSFSIVKDSLWALDILLDEAFLYDSSIFPIRHHRYGIPHACPTAHCVLEREDNLLYEFPPMTLSLFGRKIPLGGGFYFRFFPLWLVKWGVRQHNSRGDPAVLYLHPWEFDTGQPKVPADWLSRFRQYANLHTTGKKLATILQEFSFAPLKRILEKKPSIGERFFSSEEKAQRSRGSRRGN